MELFVIGATLILLLFLANMTRFILLLAVVSGAFALYYPHLPEKTKQEISTQVKHYEKRIRRAWQAFNQK